jgi:signal peptidase II
MPSITVAPRVLAGTALLGIAVDQVSKALVAATLEGHDPTRIIGDSVMIDVSRNSGAAFSFAPAATAVFSVLAIVISIVIVRIGAKLQSVGWAVVLGLVLAGAVGNLIDRLLRAPGFGRGAVVDFIYVKDFATFNIADSCITCGVVLAGILSLRGIPLWPDSASEPHPVGGDQPADEPTKF